MLPPENIRLFTYECCKITQPAGYSSKSTRQAVKKTAMFKPDVTVCDNSLNKT
jgi:hypothetical protein